MRLGRDPLKEAKFYWFGLLRLLRSISLLPLSPVPLLSCASVRHLAQRNVLTGPVLVVVNLQPAAVGKLLASEPHRRRASSRR